jgi:hypothetical protein
MKVYRIPSRVSHHLGITTLAEFVGDILTPTSGINMLSLMTTSERCMTIVRKDSSGVTGQAVDAADSNKLRFARRSRRAISLSAMASVLWSNESADLRVSVDVGAGDSEKRPPERDETCFDLRGFRVRGGDSIQVDMVPLYTEGALMCSYLCVHTQSCVNL